MGKIEKLTSSDICKHTISKFKLGDFKLVSDVIEDPLSKSIAVFNECESPTADCYQNTLSLVMDNGIILNVHTIDHVNNGIDIKYYLNTNDELFEKSIKLEKIVGKEISTFNIGGKNSSIIFSDGSFIRLNSNINCVKCKTEPCNEPFCKPILEWNITDGHGYHFKNIEYICIVGHDDDNELEVKDIIGL